MLSFFPLDVLDEIGDLIESVSEGFPTYSCIRHKYEMWATAISVLKSKGNYSRLSLSRLRLSRITAYLEEKI